MSVYRYDSSVFLLLVTLMLIVFASISLFCSSFLLLSVALHFFCYLLPVSMSQWEVPLGQWPRLTQGHLFYRRAPSSRRHPFGRDVFLRVDAYSRLVGCIELKLRRLYAVSRTLSSSTAELICCLSVGILHRDLQRVDRLRFRIQRFHEELRQLWTHIQHIMHYVLSFREAHCAVVLP